MFEVVKDMCIHQLVEAQVAKTPDATAVIFENQRLSYRELNEKANQLAHYLKDLGVKPETLVGICLERSLEMIIGLLAILKAGGAYVPLDPAYPSDRIAFMLEDSELPVLLTQQNLLEQLPQHSAQVICIDKDWEKIAHQSQENCNSKVYSNNLAYIIYTSGSTGKPKGVQIQHGSVVNLLLSMQQEPGINEKDTLLAITTFSFDLSVPDWYLPLIVGARIKLIRTEVSSEPKELAQALSQPDVTFVQATPATWRLILSAGWQGNKKLKMLCGGEALTRTLANQLLEKGESLWHMYGPTETTVWSMIHKVEWGTSPISLGYPIANTQIYLLEYPARRKNDPLKAVSKDLPGEIYIGGDGVARGYLNRPELNSERFVEDSFSQQPSKRLYRTGDLGRYLPDGTIEFLGRIDNQVKVRGYRIELGEIEEVLSQHPAVRETVVIAKEDVSESKSLVAYIVPKAENNDTQLSTLTTEFDIEQWIKVWNDTYSQSSDSCDPTFDFTGWNDSFTGSLMSGEEVHEWVDCTIERILSLHPQTVLEIGCGMGLLLFRLAPHCTHYSGIDLSAEAINHIEQRLSKENLDHVDVIAKPAHDLEEFEPKSFDTIIINSVIQYFPNINYLVQVLEKVVKLVKPGGRIFIGDVRSLPLLEAFHTGVQLAQVPDFLPCDQLKQRIQTRIAQDKELVIHPDFFHVLKHYLPQISQVETLLKRGHTQNELIRFRSDVILHVETKIETISEPLCFDWEQQQLSIPKIYQLLQENKLETLRITNILDARIITEVKGIEILVSNNKPETVEKLKHRIHELSQSTGIHPEQFWSLSEKFPYQVYITWTESYAVGKYDVILQPQSQAQQNILALPEQPLELKPWDAYANNPVRKKNTLIPKLRAFLKDKLPKYMIPSAFVVMESLPLTPNGKIDRRALPEPKKERPVLNEDYIAPSTPLEEQLAEIWSEILEIDQIGVQDNFFELGGHSLLATQMLAQAEEVIDVALPIFYLLKDPTIIGLIEGINFVHNSGSAFPIQQKDEIDWQAETTLDSTIQPEIPFTESTCEPEHIFLTGATGFLGAFLLDELLKETSANIYCLVRASNFEEGRQKIQANLERYLLWNHYHDLASRIIPVIGDLSQPLLGLTEEQFQTLASKLDLIYHAGAFVNLVYSYAYLKSINVLGTQEVLRLASLGKVTPVHYISTIDVLKPLTNFGQKVVKEYEQLDSGQDIKDGYSQSKWVAEQLIIAARSRGIPTCIYRPGMLSGHSQTGASHINDLMCRIIKGIIQLESAPDLNLWVNLIPIDYASKAIVHLSRQPKSLGQAFHIVNPKPLPWKKLIKQITDLGYNIQLLPHEDWQAKLINLSSDTDNALMPMRSLFTEKSDNQMTYLEIFLSTARAFDSYNTLTALNNTSIVCPFADTNLLKTYFSYFISSGFLSTTFGYAQEMKLAIEKTTSKAFVNKNERKHNTTNCHDEDIYLTNISVIAKQA
ncbi:amino acid adenylation domain protein [Stanieria sp. NIES-3757]|nr:amino acid adenylation domain protein [Stanieria sp. NIES-3757]